MKYLDVTFNEDGTYTIDAIGFSGTACRDFSRPIEDALGPVTSVVAKTPPPQKPARTTTVRRQISQ